MNADHCNQIFRQCIEDYHQLDQVDQTIKNPFSADSFDHLIYLKNWIDTVQWHYEDLIRDPELDPVEGMQLKRRIDASNQQRTDVVEKIDDQFMAIFESVVAAPNAGVNTESPAWVVDRLSILALKIYHMEEQVSRTDVEDRHIQIHRDKLNVLLEQQKDLSKSFDILIDDLKKGHKVMKVYRQMKLYNDPETNPVLYKKDKSD
ncbi:DUF4254 domain-containing protein [Fulvivirgaceae bacterium BMA12]|uniref:DUF4254 domain-containing protein n=1 Tax=Agaribacillus aureus TaxID=3051825 RepID=A0ABT8LCE2_9BACT|nr:DUF4254 domain-containing protein [Fulvivirgaceae bacterium BMA12]